MHERREQRLAQERAVRHRSRSDGAVVVGEERQNELIKPESVQLIMPELDVASERRGTEAARNAMTVTHIAGKYPQCIAEYVPQSASMPAVWTVVTT
mmetsp:Transcript_15288/g.41062  ORF Transcript_15288/g.41062 Transcript_15288/m.41062 type:complete len:97 (-) Transcript_15288:269-559(-)